MRRLLTIFCMLLLLAGCRTAQIKSPDPVKVTLEAGETPPPTTVNGWQVQKTGVREYTYFPPRPVPAKIKIKKSFNTDNSQRKSGNSDSFNDQKKQGQVTTKLRDVGNTTTKKASLAWLLWGIPIAVLLFYFWPFIMRLFRR